MLRENKHYLLTLFTLSLIVRGLVFGLYLSKPGSGELQEGRYWNFDSPAYHDVATSIASGHGVTNLDGSSHFYRVPAYSLFLAACYKVFGVNKIYAMWVQVVISCMIPLLIFVLAMAIFNNLLIAKVASAWSVIHLGFVLFSGLFMSETLFCIFFLMFLIFFFPSVNLFFAKRLPDLPKSFFLSGLMLGTASLFRPVGHYVLLGTALIIAFSNTEYFNKVLNFIAMLSGWLSVVIWLLVRNFILTGYIFFHTLPGVHYLNHTITRLAMAHDNLEHKVALKKVTDERDSYFAFEEKRVGRNLLEIEQCSITEKMFVKYLLKDPVETIKHSIINMLKTCFSLYSSELLFIDSGGELPTYNNRGVISILKRFLLPNVTSNFIRLIIYLEIILFALILVGFFIFLYKSLFSLKLLNIAIKGLIFIGIFVAISAACGFARLRLPIEPIVTIFSLRLFMKLGTK